MARTANTHTPRRKTGRDARTVRRAKGAGATRTDRKASPTRRDGHTPAGARSGRADVTARPGPADGPPTPAKAIPYETWTRVARTLKAVAHPERLRIINLLEGGERSVGAIVGAAGAKPAITSQQLGLMRDRGVLAARREGNHVYYRIANPHVVQVIHCIRRSCRTKEDL